MFSHYLSLLRCSFYSAPRGEVRPGRVRDNVEYVEIITGGMVRFPDENGKEYRKGAIFWHQSGEYTISHTSIREPYRCLVCQFATDGSPRQVPRCGSWGASIDLSSFVEDMLDFARRDQLDRPAVFAYCLGILLRQMEPQRSRELPRPLLRACRMLGGDPAADHSVDEVADFAGVSKSHLFTLFRKYLKTSPHHYQLEKRIILAKELLANRPDLPVKQVAESCGFAVLEVFYRHFRRFTGMTPVKFREKNSAEMLNDLR